MAVSENKEIIRRFVEEIPNKGNVARIGDFLTPESVTHFPTFDYEGAERFKELMIRGAFPDLQETIEDLIAEGDKVVERFSLRGTHRGEFMGVAPTGREVSWTAQAIYRMVDGKIAEIWVEANLLGLMLQLGVIPERR